MDKWGQQNKLLEGILTKTVQSHKIDWENHLPEALWAYKTTWKNTTGHTPSELVYGKQFLFPMEFQFKTFRIATEVGLNFSQAQQERLMQLNELGYIRKDGFQHIDLVQQQRTRWRDRFIKRKKFQEGDWALFYDSKFKDFKGKFTTNWLGPYEIEKIFHNGFVKLKTIDTKETSFLLNGHHLNLYRKPLSKIEFLQALLE